MPDFRFLACGTATVRDLVNAKPFVTAEDIKDVDFPEGSGNSDVYSTLKIF